MPLDDKAFSTARATLASRGIPLYRTDSADGQPRYFATLSAKTIEVTAGEVTELTAMVSAMAQLEHASGAQVIHGDGAAKVPSVDQHQLRADLKARFALADAALAARGW